MSLDVTGAAPKQPLMVNKAQHFPIPDCCSTTSAAMAGWPALHGVRRGGGDRPPNGKQPSFAARANAHRVRSESGSAQPRSLPGAFVKPVEGIDLVAGSTTAPEVSNNEDMTVGDLQLTDKEENQIVAFLEMLTDGYNPAKPSVSTYPNIDTFTGQCTVTRPGVTASTQGNQTIIPTWSLAQFPCAKDVCGVPPLPTSPIP